MFYLKYTEVDHVFFKGFVNLGRFYTKNENIHVKIYKSKNLDDFIPKMYRFREKHDFFVIKGELRPLSSPATRT